MAVCTSSKKGERKRPIPMGFFLEGHGLVGDAHAGGKREVSLLAYEDVEEAGQRGLKAGPGDFAENLTIRGIDLSALPVGTRLLIGKGVLLEIREKGKKCHGGCAIMRQKGLCIMPKKGVFARVVVGGMVRPGDDVEVLDDGQYTRGKENCFLCHKPHPLD